jgi:hypothetical protein
MYRRLLLVVLLCLPGFCLAIDEGKRTEQEPAFGETRAERPLIEAYEPNILGYRWPNDDVGFIDITVSLKYRLFPEHISLWTCPSGDGCQDRWRAYLGFTGQWGFYLGTRASDPVIGKSFNPKLFVRYTPDSSRNSKSFWTKGGHRIYEDWSYIDLGYAHESNGQTIDNGAAYALERRLNPDDPEFALDEVSRGWDYVQLAGKYSFLRSASDRRLALYADLKYFLTNGPIQGTPEEYHSFENDPDAKSRSEVEGVLAAMEYQWRQDLIRTKKGPVLADPRVMLQFETGYESPFQYHTFRIEIGATLMELPIALWYQDGYSSSLARYYKHSSAVGIELRLAE